MIDGRRPAWPGPGGGVELDDHDHDRRVRASDAGDDSESSHLPT